MTKTTRTMTTEYISRPAWNETHTAQRTATRQAKIEKRKNTIDTIKWCVITLIMGLAVVFAPMISYIV